ncbi:hypothetical protein ABK040_004744 [Willaertia magna]
MFKPVKIKFLRSFGLTKNNKFKSFLINSYANKRTNFLEGGETPFAQKKENQTEKPNKFLDFEKRRLNKSEISDKDLQFLYKRIFHYLRESNSNRLTNNHVASTFFWVDLLIDKLGIQLDLHLFINLIGLSKTEEECVTLFLLALKAEKNEATGKLESVLRLPKGIKYDEEFFQKYRKLYPLDIHHNSLILATAFLHALARMKSSFTLPIFREIQLAPTELFSNYHNAECYNCILHLYSKPPNIDLGIVNNLVKEMNKKEITKPNIRTHTLLLGVIINGDFSEDTKLERVIRMIEEMEFTDVAFHNKLVSNLIEQGQFALAQHVFRYMLSSTNLKPDSVTYHTMISMYFRLKRPEQALAIGKIFEADKTQQVNAYTCCLMIEGLLQCGKENEALKLYENALNNPKVSIEPVFFNSVLAAAGRMGLPHLVQRVVKDLKDLNIEPDITLYNTTLYAYSQMGLMNEAEQMYKLLKLKKLELTTRIYATLMKGYFRLQDQDAIWGVYKRFLEDVGTNPKNPAQEMDLLFLSFALLSVKTRDQLEMIFQDYLRLIQKYIEDKKDNNNYFEEHSTNDNINDEQLNNRFLETIRQNFKEDNQDESNIFEVDDLKDLDKDFYKFDTTGKFFTDQQISPEAFYYRIFRVALYQRHTEILLQLLNHMDIIATKKGYNLYLFSTTIIGYLASAGRKRVVYFFEILETLLDERKKKGKNSFLLDLLSNHFIFHLEVFATKIVSNVRIENYLKLKREETGNSEYSHIPNFAKIINSLRRK